MLGAIAGDIAGSPFEGRPGPPRGFELFHPDCRFTDDSVCTIAVADAILGGGDFAASLRTFVRRHPHRGYGGMFLDWAFSDDATAYGSWGNGAPMRVAAVGWLAGDEQEALRLAAAQAAVSHHHPDAIAAAQAVAIAILLGRTGIDKPALRQRLEDDFGYDLHPDRALRSRGFDVSAAGTAPAASAAIPIRSPASPAAWPKPSTACRRTLPALPGTSSRRTCSRSWRPLTRPSAAER